MDLKRCSACKIEQSFACFNKNRGTADGHTNTCKRCCKISYEKRKEKLLASYRIKYQNEKEVFQEKARIYRENNREKIRSQKKARYHANRDEMLEEAKLKREKHRESIRKRAKEYYRRNKDVFFEANARRRGRKIQATPEWLTQDHMLQIRELYQICQMFKLYTGQEYHVDHIVPLQGENVCGLHVPWNLQVLPAKENLSKYNSHE